MIRNLLLVMGGGAFGSGARYLFAVGAEKTVGATLWGTLAVNIIGSALLGAILASGRMSAEARLLLGTGVMGGFTTYSTFNAEVLQRLQAGEPAKAALYFAATAALCLLGAWAGFWLAR